MDLSATIRLAALVALLSLTGCSNERPATGSFDGQRAYAEVESLVQITPRDAGTPNARKAAEHIQQRLVSFDIKADIDTFTDNTPEGIKTFHNVVGRISGKSDEWIIVGSHFDTMPGIENFQGANDGGSSTGVLIELARILAGARPQTGVIFAFFDGEEGIAHYIEDDGLHGSRYMAKQLLQSGEYRKIKGMVLLDMVGDEDLHITLPANSSLPLAKEVFAAAHATGHRDRFSLNPASVITDDHVPFLQLGIPSIDLIDFNYGSGPGKNDYWHTGEDRLEHVSPQSLETTGTVVLELLREMIY